MRKRGPELLNSILIEVPGLLIALVLHELAHGLAAEALGDPTPRRMGRLTLNPLAHIDWIGLAMLALFRFGWAKPVIVDPRNFRNPRMGMLWVALAGPATNVLVALVTLVLMGHLGAAVGGGGALWSILRYTAIINVYLAVFNILPIPPLDGSKVLAAFGGEAARLVDTLGRYGWVLLLVVVYLGLLNGVLAGMANWLIQVLVHLAAPLGGI